MTFAMTLTPLDILALTLVMTLALYLVKRRLDRIEAAVNLGLTQTFEAVNANRINNQTEREAVARAIEAHEASAQPPVH